MIPTAAPVSRVVVVKKSAARPRSKKRQERQKMSTATARALAKVRAKSAQTANQTPKLNPDERALAKVASRQSSQQRSRSRSTDRPAALIRSNEKVTSHEDEPDGEEEPSPPAPRPKKHPRSRTPRRSVPQEEEVEEKEDAPAFLVVEEIDLAANQVEEEHGTRTHRTGARIRRWGAILTLAILSAFAFHLFAAKFATPALLMLDVPTQQATLPVTRFQELGSSESKATVKEIMTYTGQMEGTIEQVLARYNEQRATMQRMWIAMGAFVGTLAGMFMTE
jgi:hypothetical protein